jgi:hypothetical protein
MLQQITLQRLPCQCYAVNKTFNNIYFVYKYVGNLTKKNVLLPFFSPSRKNALFVGGGAANSFWGKYVKERRKLGNL